MLVLTRKIREGVVIDGNITITINRLTANTVQLGIEAPEKINIVRKELDSDGNSATTIETERVS